MDELVEIGNVRKAHGYAGELKLTVFEGHEDDVEAVDFLFIGRSPATALPYEIIGLRGADWICRLEGIGSKEAAAEIRGMPIFLKRSQVSDTPILQAQAASAEFQRFVGFALIDTERGEIGQIRQIDDYSLQTLAKVHGDGREFLIPMTQDFIRGVDFVKKIVFMELPDGLLEL